MLNVIQKKKQFKSVTPEKRNFAQLSQGVTGAKTDENRTVVGASPLFSSVTAIGAKSGWQGLALPWRVGGEDRFSLNGRACDKCGDDKMADGS
jgi:hypothetical protein